jgi:hypothetical protein
VLLAALRPLACRRRCGACRADAGEENVCGLVGRVLRDELAAEGALEDRPAERLRAALRAFDRTAERVDRREALLDRRAPPTTRVGSSSKSTGGGDRRSTDAEE